MASTTLTPPRRPQTPPPTTSSFFFSSSPPPSSGSKTSARTLISRAVGFASAASSRGSHTQTCTTATTQDVGGSGKTSIVSYLVVEVLSLIFRHLVNRKSILNCSLVSTHWHGPAREELARLMQDMPYNGQGLVHAIRTRFASDTFPFVSMALFDKLVCNLSEIYFRSNPETKEVFAPAYAPDMLYHLFWTFIFIDQEFRNPRTRPKVTCNYFIRLLQDEEVGYPRPYFDKKILKNIYNDIKSKPLLPAPYLIKALQEVDVSNNNGGDGRPSMRARHSSFLNLASSMKLEEPFKRVRRWWKAAREELGERNQPGGGTSPPMDSPGRSSTPDHEQEITTPTEEMTTLPPTSSSGSVNTTTIDSGVGGGGGGCDLSKENLPLSSNSTTMMSTPPSSSTSTTRQLPRSNSSTLPLGTSSAPRSFRSRFGAKSEFDLNKSPVETASHADYVPSPILTQGYTTVKRGWHPEGDGLDHVVGFPKPKKPSTLGSQFLTLQYSDLILQVEPDS
ncbi:hypothetical protein BGZ65_007400 [Modicella reniformis]|uniref:SEC7 domain-containing protein n=1 Tax=Modicella reniformis TaxID=1440133 RepID=A0A9P6JHI9_9FUNG|nr:hypothetical protein BGZ65_007400 [Modicella reniformis]